MVHPGPLAYPFKVQVKFSVEVNAMAAHIVHFGCKEYHQAVFNAFLPIGIAEKYFVSVAMCKRSLGAVTWLWRKYAKFFFTHSVPTLFAADSLTIAFAA